MSRELRGASEQRTGKAYVMHCARDVPRLAILLAAVDEVPAEVDVLVERIAEDPASTSYV